MRNLQDYVNETTQLDADDFNAQQSELENIVTSTGISLDDQGGPDTDLNMLGKAMAIYGSSGDYYQDSGSANAYVLSRSTSIKSLPSYINGMRITFYPGNNNTGASTVNVTSLGVKDLKLDDGSALTANILVAGTLAVFIYDSTAGYFKMDQRGITDIGTSFELDSDCDGDLSYSGITAVMTVDANSTGFGAALYVAADGNLEEADASAETTMPIFCLALETGTGDKKVLLQGFIRNDAWNWTPGQELYGSETTGSLTHTAPTAAGANIQIVGIATHADRMYFNKDYTTEIIPFSNDRGVFGGGWTGSERNEIDYITISTIGNAANFGDLTTTKDNTSACSNGTNSRGCFGGGMVGSYSNIIDYITISSTGNAIDFGDLTLARYWPAGCSNGTNERGCFGGGYTGSDSNVIDYITINSTGNATDFGDLTVAREGPAGCSNGTNERGCFGGGYTGSVSNVIDYITINSTGNAIDFGDLTVARGYLAGCSNGTNERGCFGGGGSYISGYKNEIDYITINSTGNATDFGDLTVARNELAACSNGTNDRGCFGGGYTGSYSDTIDYITISVASIALNFGDLTVARRGLAGCSDT